MRLLRQFEKTTGMPVKFRPLGGTELYRATNIVDVHRQAGDVHLRHDWQAVDVAHEITHLVMDVCEGFGVLAFRKGPPPPRIQQVCTLMKGYVSDEVVHVRLPDMGFRFGGEVIDASLFQRLEDWAREMETVGSFEGGSMARWDRMDLGDLKRAALYLQARLLVDRHAARLRKADRRRVARFVSACNVQQPRVAARAAKVLDLFQAHDVYELRGHGEITMGWVGLEGLDEWFGMSHYVRGGDGRYSLQLR